MAEALRTFMDSVPTTAAQARVSTSLVTLLFHTFEGFSCTNADAFLSSRNIVALGKMRDATPVALKVTLPEFAEAFENEIDVLHVLSFGVEQHVPQVLNIWRLEDGTCAFAMPWYTRTLLDEILAGTCTFDMARRVVDATVRVYAFAHANGISHCDLKAENVYLDSDGTPVIGDWDLACDNNHAEAVDVQVGTASYNPPGAFKIALTSFDADMFRLGSLMYTMMYRATPIWDGTTLHYHEEKPCVFTDDAYTAHMLRLLRQNT